MRGEEESGAQDRIVEEEGEDDAISSTSPECMLNTLSNQEDNDQQPERAESMQNTEFDDAHTTSVPENENISIGIGETNDNSPVPAPDATGDTEDFDSS